MHERLGVTSQELPGFEAYQLAGGGRFPRLLRADSQPPPMPFYLDRHTRLEDLIEHAVDVRPEFRRRQSHGISHTNTSESHDTAHTYV